MSSQNQKISEIIGSDGINFLQSIINSASNSNPYESKSRKKFMFTSKNCEDANEKIREFMEDVAKEFSETGKDYDVIEVSYIIGENEYNLSFNRVKDERVSCHGTVQAYFANVCDEYGDDLEKVCIYMHSCIGNGVAFVDVDDLKTMYDKWNYNEYCSEEDIVESLQDYNFLKSHFDFMNQKCSCDCKKHESKTEDDSMSGGQDGNYIEDFDKETKDQDNDDFPLEEIEDDDKTFSDFLYEKLNSHEKCDYEYVIGIIECLFRKTAYEHVYTNNGIEIVAVRMDVDDIVNESNGVITTDYILSNDELMLAIQNWFGFKNVYISTNVWCRGKIASNTISFYMR